MSGPDIVLPGLAFYFFSAITLAAATLVIVSRNPVHSVLFLILSFFSSAGLFLLNGAEFLAMILVIVYVGAVAVLFMFVVMMLDVDMAALREGVHQYAPIGLLVGAVLLIELILIIATWSVPRPELSGYSFATGSPDAFSGGTAQALGAVLYTRYVYVFQISGLILLVAMIGAIALTLRHRSGVRRQDIAAQCNRSIEESIELKKPGLGQGVDI